MKKIYIKILSALIAPLLVAGCIEESFPEGATQVQKQVGESEFALTGLVNAFPVSMTSVDVTSFYSKYETHTDFGLPAIHLMTESMLEDIAIQGAEPGYWSFNYWSRNVGMNDQSWPIGYFWENYYAYIKVANDVISVIPVSDNMPPVAKTYLGQAYAYRAMYYLDLARMYEPKENNYTDISAVKGLTVPIVSDKTTPEQASNNPRVPREEMYEFILSDLAEAVKYLKDAPTAYTSPSLAAAYGLLARAYLEKGYWKEGGDIEAFKEAYKYADLAITTSGKTPLTNDEWHNPTTGFNDGSAVNSWILGIPVSSENVGNIIAFSAHMAAETQYGYTTLTQPGINKELYDVITDGDFRKNSYLSPNTDTWVGPNSPYKYAGTTEDRDIFLSYFAKPYSTLKFRPAKGNCTNSTIANEADHCLMRVEEMYFIKIEAMAHYDATGAFNQLKSFMAKRMLPGYTYSPELLAVDTQSVIDEMFLQKRIEFWGEGILFFDYKRLNKGIKRRYDGTNHPGIWQFNTTGRSPQWNFVINRGEFQANTGITKETNNPDPSGLLTNTTE